MYQKLSTSAKIDTNMRFIARGNNVYYSNNVAFVRRNDYKYECDENVMKYGMKSKNSCYYWDIF